MKIKTSFLVFTVMFKSPISETQFSSFIRVLLRTQTWKHNSISCCSTGTQLPLLHSADFSSHDRENGWAVIESKRGGGSWHESRFSKNEMNISRILIYMIHEKLNVFRTQNLLCIDTLRLPKNYCECSLAHFDLCIGLKMTLRCYPI